MGQKESVQVMIDNNDFNKINNTKFNFYEEEEYFYYSLSVNNYKMAIYFTKSMEKYKIREDTPNIEIFLKYIISNCSLDTIKIFYENFPIIFTDHTTPLMLAINRENNIENIKEYDESIEYIDDSLLIVKFLIDNKLNINEIDKEGNNALIYACKKNKEEIVDYLINNGINLNTQNFIGKTALMYADTYKIAKLLIDKDADVNIVDDKGVKTFMYLCRIDSVELFNLMLDKKCKIDTYSFKTSLEIPKNIFNKIIEQTYMRLDHVYREDDDSSDTYPATLLMYSCKYGWNDIATTLINKRWNIDTKNKAGKNAVELMSIESKSILLPILRKINNKI